MKDFFHIALEIHSRMPATSDWFCGPAIVTAYWAMVTGCIETLFAGTATLGTVI